MEITIKEVLTKEIQDLQKQNDFPKINVTSFFSEKGDYIFYLRQQFRKNVIFFSVSSNSDFIITAQERASLIRLTNCVFIEADLEQLPKRINNTHLAYAIDALKNSVERLRFVQQIYQKLATNGKLIIIDTFLTVDFFTRKLSQQQLQNVEDIRNSGLGKNLMAVVKMIQIAEKEGFVLVKNENLTPNITFKISSSVKIATFFLGKQLRKRSSFQNKIGENARQQCLKQGLVEYRLLIFEKKENVLLLS